MTLRQAYEYCMVELDTLRSPTLTLSDFNYFFNKEIINFVEGEYDVFEVTQKISDEIGCLKVPFNVVPLLNKYGKYEIVLPKDYLHILNCKVFYSLLNCPITGYSVIKITSDQIGTGENYYFKPKFNSPQYRLINRIQDSKPLSFDFIKSDFENISNPDLIDPITFPIINNDLDETYYGLGEDDRGLVISKYVTRLMGNEYYIGSLSYQLKNIVNDYAESDKAAALSAGQSLLTTISDKIADLEDVSQPSLRDPIYIKKALKDMDSFIFKGVDSKFSSGVRVLEDRDGRPSLVLLELDCGNLKGRSIQNVSIDYLRTPKYVQLKDYQLDLIDDVSQVLEFSDSACMKIINGVVKMIMENKINQRLNTFIPINQTAQPQK